MKTKMILAGGSKKEIALPEVFSFNIREDIAQKYFETEKRIQPYGPNPRAGKEHSAAGIVRHARKKWKGAYGHGISRVPRKILWRRGTQFYWVGAFISAARGGRRPHAPIPEHFTKEKKINKKEVLMAVKSAIASTASIELLKKRYSTMADKKVESLPLVIDGSMLKMKSKEFFKFLSENFKEFESILFKKKSVRAGRGKSRNRRYKSSAGLLLVVGGNEHKKISGIDVRKVDEIEIGDLMPLGRLTLYTEEALKEIASIAEGKSKENKTKGDK